MIKNILTVKNISPYEELVSTCKKPVSLVLPSICIKPVLPESSKCALIVDCEAPTPTYEFPAKATSPGVDTLFANKLSVSDFVYESGNTFASTYAFYNNLH